VKIGMLDEASLRPGLALDGRYREVLEHIEACEAAGFHVFGMAEQHFIPDIGGLLPGAAAGAPEVFYGWAAARTERIRIRSAIAVLPLHHPLSTAERYATVDILSGGRFEFGTGRGNNHVAAAAFQVPLDETSDRWAEALELIIGAWTSEDEFSWDGRFFQVPPRSFRPKPLQDPHPPLLYAALSPEAHRVAGHLGLGLITSTFGIPLKTTSERIGVYREALETVEPVGKFVNDYVSLNILGHCATSQAQAKREAEQPLLEYCLHSSALYEQTIARTNPDVDFSGVRARFNYEDMRKATIIISGEPEEWVEKLLSLEDDLGVDEVTVNFAAIEHDAVMRAIELFGERVIPHVTRSEAPAPA
jgi:alkanesulfonate monooxygenase SsuD/methylene tetrahydromethanopterin reductase-like flavin-dependent oxidoreductase (luciferase family)